MVQPDLIEYKCPQCGGVLEFDSASQQMKCPYCDSVFSVEALQSKDEALENTVDGQWQPPETTFDESETANMGVYTCKSCGGEIVADETTGATHCPYCDNPTVVPGQFAGTLKPDFVVHGDNWKSDFQKPIREEVLSLLGQWDGELVEYPYT